MEAKELRIGNYLSYTDNDDTWTVEIETIAAEGCHTHCNGIFEYLEIELMMPIPLTEEWLLKMGFDEITPKYYVLNIDENISFTYYYTFSGGVWHFEFEGVSIKIKHVHQLQNLYHALTGEELIIKEL